MEQSMNQNAQDRQKLLYERADTKRLAYTSNRMSSSQQTSQLTMHNVQNNGSENNNEPKPGRFQSLNSQSNNQQFSLDRVQERTESQAQINQMMDQVEEEGDKDSSSSYSAASDEH